MQFNTRMNQDKRTEQEAVGDDQWIIEVSCEVANKVGGIYTVIRSKVPVSVEELGNRYVLVGPYKEYANLEVERKELPFGSPLSDAVQRIREKFQFQVITGYWMVEGTPQVILLDTKSAFSRLPKYKSELCRNTQIELPDGDGECDEALVFGHMTAEFLAEFNWQVHRRNGNKAKIVAHFHEWLSAIGLLLLNRWGVSTVATVFTTHATLLGRYLCAAKVDFYNNVANFRADEEAKKRAIFHRHWLEKEAARLANVFTTVSEMTGLEAEHLLNRKPDLITPNGLNVAPSVGEHEFQNKHAACKEKINDFVRSAFVYNMDFDLDKTLYFFTAGRYEYENKGVDMFIESLSRLNVELKKSASDVTVVAFLIFPTKTLGFNEDILLRQSTAKTLKDTIQEMCLNSCQRIYQKCVEGKRIDAQQLDHGQVALLNRHISTGQSKNANYPPITTHKIVDDFNDPILHNLRRHKLFNRDSDRVKVFFHPEFLTRTNPLIPLDYEDFVRGCNLGVFASYYEPWGYTPAECTINGIPSITSNLSGFGCFMNRRIKNPETNGIYIVDRRLKSVEESVHQLMQQMLQVARLNPKQRMIQRRRTQRLSSLLDWTNLGVHYRQARKMALRRTCSGLSFKDDECANQVDVLTSGSCEKQELEELGISYSS